MTVTKNKKTDVNPTQIGFDILPEDKILVKQIRVIKVVLPDQLDGVVTPLAHAPDRWNSHRK
jgi:hypothetical protein